MKDIANSDDLSQYFGMGDPGKNNIISEPVTEYNGLVKVLVIEPEKAPYVKEIDPVEPILMSEVSGYYKYLYPFDDDVAVVINSDTHLFPFAPNRALYDDHGNLSNIIWGTFLIVGQGRDDVYSLTDKQIRKYTERFASPEAFVNISGRIHVLKLKEDHSQRKSIMDKLKRPTIRERLKQKKKTKEVIR